MLQFSRLGARLIAADRNVAPIRSAQTFQNFNGAGFASSVRTEQPEYFPFGDPKADTSYSLNLAVAFSKIFNVQNGIAHKKREILQQSDGACSPSAWRGILPFCF